MKVWKMKQVHNRNVLTDFVKYMRYGFWSKECGMMAVPVVKTGHVA